MKEPKPLFPLPFRQVKADYGTASSQTGPIAGPITKR
jgi:hypothetical protein